MWTIDRPEQTTALSNRLHLWCYLSRTQYKLSRNTVLSKRCFLKSSDGRLSFWWGQRSDEDDYEATVQWYWDGKVCHTSTRSPTHVKWIGLGSNLDLRADCCPPNASGGTCESIGIAVSIFDEICYIYIYIYIYIACSAADSTTAVLEECQMTLRRQSVAERP